MFAGLSDRGLPWPGHLWRLKNSQPEPPAKIFRCESHPAAGEQNPDEI